MLYDSHAHQTPFSHDAGQTVGQLLERASQMGLAGVCVTDHYEKDIFYTGGREDIFDLDNYFQVLEPLRATLAALDAADAVKLFIGVELGYLPHLADHLREMIPSRPFDGVILSLHVLKGADPFCDPGMFLPGKIRVYTDYLLEMTEMVRRCPNFDMLGHFDYISRYGPYPDRKMRYAEMPAAFDTLLGTLAEMGKALEINTRTVVKLRKYGYSATDSWPDEDIIRRFKELGGRFITLGSDAHQPTEAGCLVNDGAAWLQGLGWPELTHYEKRRALQGL